MTKCTRISCLAGKGPGEVDENYPQFVPIRTIRGSAKSILFVLGASNVQEIKRVKENLLHPRIGVAKFVQRAYLKINRNGVSKQRNRFDDKKTYRDC